jgi:DNA repair protein RecO (recombination protein O)
MSEIVTDAIVLHAFDYLESSRILKLITREAGVRSVLARGARRSKKRFGAALDLCAQGTAELHTKPGRDLDTLGAFDVVRVRSRLAEHIERFTAASAIAELTLRFGRDAADPELFDIVEATFDDIMNSPAERSREAALAGAWRILQSLGVAPTIDRCAECHAEIDASEAAIFSHPAGGVVCARCGHLARGSRTLPANARAALRDWLAGQPHSLVDTNESRAHQRLLREFLREHLADDRPLNAFDVWEQGTWSAPAKGATA